MSDFELISISDYADLHGVARKTVQEKCQRGALKTARKVSNRWVIDRNEPYIDNRVTSGKYVNWRKQKEEK